MCLLLPLIVLACWRICVYVPTYRLVTMTPEGECISLWIGSLAKTLVQDEDLLEFYIPDPFGNYVIQAVLNSDVGPVHAGAIGKLVLSHLKTWTRNKHVSSIISLCCQKGDRDFLNRIRGQWEVEVVNDIACTFELRIKINSQLRRRHMRMITDKGEQMLQSRRSGEERGFANAR